MTLINQLPFNVLYSTFIPALLLVAAATLLDRAKEIDLSLDQQCYFVACAQAVLFSACPAFLAILGSCVLIIVLQSARVWFNRRMKCDTFVMSIAAGMIYTGAAFVLPWAVGVDRNPPYLLPLTPFWVAAGAMMLLAVTWAADRLSADAQRVTFPLRPDVAGTPDLTSSIQYAVVPAALLTTAAATLLAAYAGNVTQSSSSSLGILAATIAILTFGRLARGIVAGAGIAAIIIFAQETALVPAGVLQSHVLPIFTFAVVGLIALLKNRP